jgi:hypothetical protein
VFRRRSKHEVAGLSETWVPVCQAAWHHISEDSNLVVVIVMNNFILLLFFILFSNTQNYFVLLFV